MIDGLAGRCECRRCGISELCDYAKAHQTQMDVEWSGRHWRWWCNDHDLDFGRRVAERENERALARTRSSLSRLSFNEDKLAKALVMRSVEFAFAHCYRRTRRLAINFAENVRVRGRGRGVTMHCSQWIFHLNCCVLSLEWFYDFLNHHYPRGVAMGWLMLRARYKYAR